MISKLFKQQEKEAKQLTAKDLGSAVGKVTGQLGTFGIKPPSRFRTKSIPCSTTSKVGTTRRANDERSSSPSSNLCVTYRAENCGDTTLTMSWPFLPDRAIKHKCTISTQPEKDTAKMITDAFEGIKDEIKRVSKKAQ
ncbi:hypothetical protein HGG76_26635 [Ochrobactrum tritici]|uniref:Uncharacterized protein n=1 Tax=Brucella tritici TaxID=94626 RepID=A0A7X6FVI2_9HYPH|nr:hypothetical protein [Brucella tritici]